MAGRGVTKDPQKRDVTRPERDVTSADFGGSRPVGFGGRDIATSRNVTKSPFLGWNRGRDVRDVKIRFAKPMRLRVALIRKSTSRTSRGN